MNIKILKFVDKETIADERVTFSVLVDDFLGAYAAFKTHKSGPNKISASVEDTYWFPDKDVKKGDLVVLYTKKGANTETKNEDGTTTHFFFWGFEKPLWNSPEDALVILKLAEWNYKLATSPALSKKPSAEKKI